MENLDWSQFKKRVSINADKKTIFEYWSSQMFLEAWFLSSAVFFDGNNEARDKESALQPGDTYKWMWHGSDTIAEGEVVETNNTDFLKFTFLGCVVTVEVKEEAGENLVEVIQSEIALDDVSRMSYYVGCTRGWTFYMANLKSILEGGIDLRNKNMDLVDVINT